MHLNTWEVRTEETVWLVHGLCMLPGSRETGRNAFGLRAGLGTSAVKGAETD